MVVLAIAVVAVDVGDADADADADDIVVAANDGTPYYGIYSNIVRCYHGGNKKSHRTSWWIWLMSMSESDAVVVVGL